MIKFRYMKKEDFDTIFHIMRVFYDSPAIEHSAPDEILKQDIRDCISDMPFVEGFVFDDNGQTAGYAMTARGYSTEYGGICIWLEDLYILPEYRGAGIGTQFFSYLEDLYCKEAVRLRLEVAADNTRAIEVYKKCGYRTLPYVEMSKEFPL